MTEIYYMDGRALPPANGGVKCRRADLESGESGRDEGGFLHRVVLRTGVLSWVFSYRDLTPTACRQLLEVLPQKDCFLLQGEDARRCYLEEISTHRRDTLQGTVYDVTLTVREC